MASDHTGGRATATHAVFISLALLVVLPSRFIDDLQGRHLSGASSALETFGALVVWLLLWRLCVVRQSPTFLALAIAAVFLSSFRRPLLGCAIGLILLLIHVRLDARQRKVSAAAVATAREAEVEGRTSGRESSQAPCREREASTADLELVDLDPIVAPYARLLLAVRTIRAAVASMLFVTLTTIPDALISPALDGYEPIGGLYFALVAGVPMTVLAFLVSLFFFKALRGLWGGSATALWGWFALSVIVIPWGAFGLYLDTSRQDLVDGRVWVRATDFALHNVIFVALAFGTAFVVRRQRHASLLALLRENRRRDWRTALLQLCGVVWPRVGWRSALRSPSVRWSVFAFLLEGVGFHPIGSSNTTSAYALTVLSPLPDSLSPLEGHYLTLSVIVCLFAPGLFVWTQAMFRLADMARSRARRAALKPATEARRLDDRPPVLFLRSFENDQVSLRSASMAFAVRLADPAFEHAHLEDVLQTCLSIGPVIAIGRPDDVVPPVGVPRLYVETIDWQEVVIGLMHDASLIVVGISDSTGLRWEVEQLTTRHYLEKTVFVVPPEQARNGRLLGSFIPFVFRQTAAWKDEVAPIVGTRLRVVGLTCRAGKAKIFVSARKLSQIQYEVTLRLATQLPA